MPVKEWIAVHQYLLNHIENLSELRIDIFDMIQQELNDYMDTQPLIGSTNFIGVDMNRVEKAEFIRILGEVNESKNNTMGRNSK
jgi:hypothetical protein